MEKKLTTLKEDEMATHENDKCVGAAAVCQYSQVPQKGGFSKG